MVEKLNQTVQSAFNLDQQTTSTILEFTFMYFKFEVIFGPSADLLKLSSTKV